MVNGTLLPIIKYSGGVLRPVSVSRQLDLEVRAFAFAALETHVASVRINHGARQPQTYPHALCFVRLEKLEDRWLELVRNPHAIVTDVEYQATIGIFSSHVDSFLLLLTRRERIEAIVQQVEDHLLQLCGIPVYFQTALEPEMYSDLLVQRPRLDQCQCVPDELIKKNEPVLLVRMLKHMTQLGDDVGRATVIHDHGIEEFARTLHIDLGVVQLALDQLCIETYRANG